MYKIFFLAILLSTLSFGEISIFISSKHTFIKVSRKEVANLFLKKTDNIRGIKFIPLDNNNKKIFNKFYKTVIRKTPSQLHSYWIKQIFKGKRQPPKKLSSQKINKLMSKHNNYISYNTHPKKGMIILTLP